jgi:hypothetical protein
MLNKDDIAALMKDLKLCTDTAAALSSKLSKLQETIIDMFEQLNLLQEVAVPARQPRATAPAAFRPTAAPARRPTAATPASRTASWQADVSDQGVSSELDEFVAFLKGTDDPHEISKRLSQLRDRLMEVSTSHNPAFFEMGSWANRIGKLGARLEPNEKEELLNKAYDWRVRLTQ